MSGPQPSYPPFTPDPLEQATRRKPKSKLLIALAAVAVVLVLACCGGIVGTIAGTDPTDTAPVAGKAKSTPTPAKTSASPSPSATPSPSASTTTPPPPPPPSPKEPAPKTWKGNGDKVIKLGDLTELRVVHFKCTCYSNTVVKSDGDPLLVNEIGNYNGKFPLNLQDGSLTTRLEIKASGSWTLTMGTVSQLAVKAPADKASGKGDSVVLMTGGTTDTVKITHRGGQSNFAVHGWSLDSGEGGLMVNEIGGYTGEVPLDTPALVKIHADGNWTISPV